MSTKINALIPAAAAAAGIPIPTISPVAEPLLSTLAVTAIYCAEIQDASGKFMMFATIGADTRAVAGTDGNVKLYANSLAALRAAKIANLAGKLEFSIYEKIPTVGDPLASLQTRYKQACVKGFASIDKLKIVKDKITNAETFGWDTSTGATRTEYNDLISRRDVVQQWHDAAQTQIVDLAARLTSVGVDPVTVANAPAMD